MRKELGAVLFLVVTGVALIASVYFSTRPQSQPVNTRAMVDIIPNDIDPLSGQIRERISLTEANLAVTRKLLPPGTKTLLKVPSQLRHGDYMWDDEGVPAGTVVIWVDLRRQMISAFRDGHEIGTAVVVYGAKDMASPEGVFPILRKVRDYHSRAYDAPMPDSLFITNDGVALHGSPMSSRRASHGCIGLPVGFSRKLFEASNVGDIVEIARSDPLLGR